MEKAATQTEDQLSIAGVGIGFSEKSPQPYWLARESVWTSAASHLRAVSSCLLSSDSRDRESRQGSKGLAY